MRTQWLDLFKVLLPSWTFFDQIGTVPTLEYRFQKQGPWSDWQSLLPVSRTSALCVFLNAQGNAELAKRALLERIVDEINEDRDIRKSVTYELIRNWVSGLVREQSPQAFQFRVNMLELSSQRQETTLVSEEFSWKD